MVDRIRVLFEAKETSVMLLDSLSKIFFGAATRKKNNVLDFSILIEGLLK